MSQPNKKFSVRLTAKEWGMISDILDCGELDAQAYIEEVESLDGVDVEAKTDFLYATRRKFNTQLNKHKHLNP